MLNQANVALEELIDNKEMLSSMLNRLNSSHEQADMTLEIE
jgi:hypothetical protein